MHKKTGYGANSCSSLTVFFESIAKCEVPEYSVIRKEARFCELEINKERIDIMSTNIDVGKMKD